jgi:predicted nucleic acid-binding protein
VILVDTNVLYALADRSDRHHTRCTDWLKHASDDLVIPATVLAETCYLIDRTLGPKAEAAFLDSVGTGSKYLFQLVELVDSDLRRMARLVSQYADRRLGGTDASVVAICERLEIVTVATVNLRDFANVRPRHVPSFTTVPGLG